MNMIAETHGWAKFVSMQDMHSLVYREEEKEMHPMLLDQGVACTPFSPLVHGVFANQQKYAHFLPAEDGQTVVHVLAERGGEELAAQGVLAHLNVVALLRDEL